MNPIKFARADEITLLEAAGYQCLGRSRKFPSFTVMCLGAPPANIDVIDDEEEHLIKAVQLLEGATA